MRVKRSTWAIVLLLLVSTLFSVQLAVMQESDLGTDANPIRLYFVPSAEAQVVVSGGEVLKAALEEATGLRFEVEVPNSYPATIEEMCASPDNSIGFIPAAGYVIANNRCGIEVGAAAVRNGRNVYWAGYYVRRDSDIYVLGDLEGRTWGYNDATSTSGYIVPSVELQAMGITPGEQRQTGGHPQTILAVYNGDVDFGTSYYSPPDMPGAEWRPGDLPEPYDLTVDEPLVTEDAVFVGDIEILDVRATAREVAPDIIEAVRILAISAPIPNDTMSFGPEFPEELRQEIIDAIIAFSQTDAWAESLGDEDFYGWDGLAPIDDAAFDSVRLQFEILGLTEDDIFG